VRLKQDDTLFGNITPPPLPLLRSFNFYKSSLLDGLLVHWDRHVAGAGGFSVDGVFLSAGLLPGGVTDGHCGCTMRMPCLLQQCPVDIWSM